MDRIDLINDFKEQYKKLLKWDSYMIEKSSKMDPASAKWKEIVDNFFEKVVEPCENAWALLTSDEKKIFF